MWSNYITIDKTNELLFLFLVYFDRNKIAHILMNVEYYAIEELGH